MPLTLRIAAGTIVVGLVVLALKGAAWWVTGSAALYSDALETVVNVAASLIAFQALRVAGRPADRDHPFGHAKAEFLAAGLEGALIVAAAGSILQAAWHGWQHPHVLDTPWFGLALNGVATVINFGWAQVLLRVAGAGKIPRAGRRCAAFVGRRSHRGRRGGGGYGGDRNRQIVAGPGSGGGDGGIYTLFRVTADSQLSRSADGRGA